MKHIDVFIAVLIAIAVLCFAIVFWSIQTNGQDSLYCKGGYMFVKSSGRQLIGENGGGVPCGEKK